jgi:tetratricopeptide (TPR) repeat protein
MLSQRLLVDQDCQQMSIVGLGGTGKTQVALQFAYMVKETMSAVSIFWMPALSMESFEQACAGIVAALHIGQAGAGEDDAKEVLREHLCSERAGRWLLVLDNADDDKLLFGAESSKGIIDYIPDSEKGMILFTTRMQDVAVSLTRGDVLELGSMSERDAAEFLKKSLIRKDPLEDKQATAELLRELTCLPLAIAQAAAYLNMNKTTITKYLQLLKSTEQDIVGLMSKEFRDHTRYRGSANAIASAWVVSFSQLQERDAAAADLLKFMSCIEWKAIPRSLLPKVQPQERMEEALGILCGYSFVSRREDNSADDANGEKEWYDLHRLVHLATRIWINKCGDAADETCKAMRHVDEIFPSDDFTNQAVWRGYMPHALRLLETRHSCDIENRAGLSLLVGQCLHADGRVPESVRWLEGCCRMREVLEETHPRRLASQHRLGVSYWANGQIKEAVDLMEHVVKVRKVTLAETHPDQLASQHELGVFYWANGQIKEAVELLEHIVNVQKVTLIETHPDQLQSQHQLGVSYWANGQIKEAVELLEYVIKVRKVTLAETHPDMLASQHALGVFYWANGQIKESIELMEHVVKVRKVTLAETHPHRLQSQHQLCVSYLANGQIKESMELMEHVVKVRKVTLAETHPDMLASQHALSAFYWANKQINEAMELMEHVVKVRKVTLAETHPDLLTSQHQLSVSYWTNGQEEEAVELMEHVVKVRKVTLAETHPDRLGSEGYLSYMMLRE